MISIRSCDFWKQVSHWLTHIAPVLHSTVRVTAANLLLGECLTSASHGRVLSSSRRIRPPEGGFWAPVPPHVAQLVKHYTRNPDAVGVNVLLIKLSALDEAASLIRSLNVIMMMFLHVSSSAELLNSYSYAHPPLCKPLWIMFTHHVIYHNDN